MTTYCQGPEVVITYREVVVLQPGPQVLQSTSRTTFGQVKRSLMGALKGRRKRPAENGASGYRKSNSGESPVVARRRVRLALREAREAMNLTQGQVAEAMEWSLSKVMRIESGEVSITANDLRLLLAYLGITDRSRVDELVQDARLSRRRQMWWDEPRRCSARTRSST